MNARIATNRCPKRTKNLGLKELSVVQNLKQGEMKQSGGMEEAGLGSHQANYQGIYFKIPASKFPY